MAGNSFDLFARVHRFCFDSPLADRAERFQILYPIYSGGRLRLWLLLAVGRLNH